MLGLGPRPIRPVLFWPNNQLIYASQKKPTKQTARSPLPRQWEGPNSFFSSRTQQSSLLHGQLFFSSHARPVCRPPAHTMAQSWWKAKPMLLLCACEGRPTWPANPLALGGLSIARRCQQIGQLSNAPDAHLFCMPRNRRALHPRLSRAYNQLVFMPRRFVPSPAWPHAESTTCTALAPRVSSSPEGQHALPSCPLALQATSATLEPSASAGRPCSTPSSQLSPCSYSCVMSETSFHLRMPLSSAKWAHAAFPPAGFSLLFLRMDKLASPHSFNKALSVWL